MRETNSYKQLRENLLSLNLNQMALHLDEVLDFGIQSGASLTEVLVKLTNHEIDIQEQQKTHRMIRSAALPSPKRLDTFDFSFQPSLNRDQIADLHSLRFIERNENVVFLGPSGVGKTHLATSIGVEAALARHSTYFTKCHDRIQKLRIAKQENRLETKLKHFARYRLLIIDEIGYLPIDAEDAKIFFQLIDQRYEKKSTILTTNINFGSWEEVFVDPKLANAILDRILHHATVVPISGDSYRLKDHRTEQTASDETDNIEHY